MLDTERYQAFVQRLYARPWHADIGMLLDFHIMCQEVRGKVVRNGSHKEGWSAADTAKELNRSRSSVIKDLELADKIRLHPELRSYKRKSQAINAAKKSRW